MADDIDNTIGFDATDALKTLKILEISVSAYTRAIKENTTATGAFNKKQTQVDSVLDGMAKGAREARLEFERLAKAQQNAARLAASRSALTKERNAAKRTQRAQDVSGFLERTIETARPRGPTPALVNYDKALDSFEKLVAKTKIGESRIGQILRNLQARYRGAEREIRDSIVKIIAAQGKLGGSNVNRSKALLNMPFDLPNQGLKQFDSGIKKAKQSTDDLLLSWQSVLRIFTGQLIYRGISEFTQQLGDAISRSRELQLSLAEIQTIAGPDLRFGSRDQVQAITSQLSGDFGIDQVEAATGVYEAFSNQVGTTAEVIRFMQATATFAKASVSDLADSGDLLSGVLNSYGLEVENATKISDILFKTIDVGRVKAEDLANTLGRVAPLAAQLGVGFDELSAAIATITIQGVLPDDALTQTQNIMKGLIKPTEALQKRFEQLGITSAEVGVQQFGLVGFVQEIIEGASSVEDLSKYFDDIRELRGVLSVLSQDGALYANTLRQIREESDGAAQAAADLILSTPAAELQKAIEQFKNVLTADVGDTFVTFFNDIVQGFGGAEDAAKVFSATLIGGATAATTLIGVGLVVGIGKATAALLAFVSTGAIALGTLGGLLTFAGFAAVVGTLVYLNNEFESSIDFLGQMQDELKFAGEQHEKFVKESIASQQELNRAIQQTTDYNTQAVLSTLANRQKATSAIRNQAELAERAITKNLNEEIQKRARLVDSFVESVEDSIQDASDNIRRIAEDSRDFEFKINQGRFERNLEGLDPRQEVFALQKRVKDLLSAQSRASAVGDTDFARTVNDEALQVATRLAEVAGYRRQGESAINTVLKARQEFNSKLISQEEARAQAAQTAKGTLSEQNTAIQEQATQLQDIVKELQKGNISGQEFVDLQNQAVAAAAELQKNLSAFGDADLVPGFDKELAKIKEGFFGLQGTPIPLDFLVDESLTRIRGTLNQARLSAKLELQIAEITGIEGGFDQVPAVAEHVAKLSTEIKKNRDNAVGLEAAYADAGFRLKNFTTILDTLEAETGKISNAGGNTIRTMFESFGYDSAGRQNREKGAQSLFDALKRLREELNTAVSEKDLQKLVEVQKRLSAFTNTQATTPFLGDFNIQLQALTSEINAFVAAQEKIATISVAQTAAEAGEKEIAKLLQLFPESEGILQSIIKSNLEMQNAAQSSDNGYGRAKLSVEALDSKIKETIRSQQTLNQLLNSVPSTPAGVPQGRQRGGPIHYFAGGGSAARGSDTVPAMLSPGEFIMNASSSRRFYSELVSMNSGRAPTYRESGGSVSNTFTGDINVNLPAGSNLSNGREAASAIRRELRRKTSKF